MVEFQAGGKALSRAAGVLGEANAVAKDSHKVLGATEPMGPPSCPGVAVRGAAEGGPGEGG